MTRNNIERERFISDNIGLVHACARRFKNRGAEYEDLFQAGCVGLVKAFDAFDWDRGLKFSTYAVPVILGEIKRIFRDGGAIKVSRSLKDLSRRVAAVTESFCEEHAREPALSELAVLLGCSEEAVSEAVCSARVPVSLTVDSDDEFSRILDLPAEGYEDKLTDRLSLESALKKLDTRERLLLELRFVGCKTQSDAAAVLGTTQVQISRLERKLLCKLREIMTDD